MRRACKVAVALLPVALGAQAYSSDAAATAVNVDEFGVVRNGTTLFDDSFSQNTTLVGGSGTVLPSGTNFSDGTPASYRVIGSIPETTANNGQAQLNTANGFMIGQTLETAASLSTGTNASLPHALTSTNTFSAIALFDLAVPSIVSGRYDVFFTNNTATPGRNLQIRLQQTAGGPELRFQLFDFVTNQLTIISELPLTPAELAAPQVGLGFLKDNASSDVLTALYAFGSGNTLASFNGTLTAPASTDAGTDVFTPTLNWGVSGFETIDPVPEPSSLALLAAAALCSQGVIRRYAK
jgi:hypothetical protein